MVARYWYDSSIISEDQLETHLYRRPKGPLRSGRICRRDRIWRELFTHWRSVKEGLKILMEPVPSGNDLKVTTYQRAVDCAVEM